MPELPEVETICRGLEGVLRGRRFAHVEQRRKDLRFPLPERFVVRLTGRRIERLERRAKYILMHLDEGEVMSEARRQVRAFHKGRQGFPGTTGISHRCGIEKGLAQGELAEAMGVSRQTINSIENERYTPSLPLALALARYFGVTVEEMFDDHG